MTGPQGNPPSVGLRVDQVDYWPGDTVVATPTYSDPDTRVEPPMESDGTGPLGEAVHIVEQRWHTDTPDAVWFWVSAPDQLLGRGVLPLRITAPAASDTLVLRVTDRQRLVGEARVQVVVAGLQLGVSVHADTAAEFTSELALVAGGLELDGMTKLFSSGSLPTPAKWPVPAGMLPVICFPDMPTEADFRARVATINRPTLLVHAQESDRKLTLTEYHRRMNLLAGWLDEAPAGVELMVNLTASAGRSRRTATATPTGCRSTSGSRSSGSTATWAASATGGRWRRSWPRRWRPSARPKRRAGGAGVGGDPRPGRDRG
jgi:hypothetical protein